MLIKILEPPKSPPNNGKSGSFTGEFKAVKPNIPVDKNTIKAVQILSSLSIVYDEMKINKNGIRGIIFSYIGGMNFVNKGVIKIIRGIEVITPINTIRIASFPFPCFSISCPGRTDRKDSASVAPVNIEGMKSSMVCVIASETTNIIRDVAWMFEKTPRFATRRAVTVFMWIPGVMPVNVPITIPTIIARIKSQGILS